MNTKKNFVILAFAAISMFAQSEEIPSQIKVESPADKAVVKLQENIKLNTEKIGAVQKQQVADAKELIGRQNELQTQLNTVKSNLLRDNKDVDKTVSDLQNNLKEITEEIGVVQKKQAADAKELNSWQNEFKAQLDDLKSSSLKDKKDADKAVSDLQNNIKKNFEEIEVVQKQQAVDAKELLGSVNEIQTRLDNLNSNLLRDKENAERTILDLQNNIKNNTEKIGLIQKQQVVVAKEFNRDLLKLKEDGENTAAELRKSIRQSSDEIKSAHEKQFTKLQNAIDTTQEKISETETTLQSNIESNSNETHVVRAELESKVEATNQSIAEINKNINQNITLWIMVILLFILFVFVFSKRMVNQKNNTLLKRLEEGNLKLDNKLVEIIESQIGIMKDFGSGGTQEDHSLALKVADEIIRIKKNLSQMDDKTRGLKQLTASVKRIEDNFVANGYEIVEMLGLAFDTGMKVTANFIPDEDLEEDQQIITRIIKPHVNYNGVMIQAGQVEVSQGC